MKILIIYDTFFGNTQKVAESIGDYFIEKSHDVEISSVKETYTSKLSELDLLIIGSPTRAFKPTKEIVTFIKSIDKNSAKKIKFAVFDTRMDVAKVNNKLLTFMVKVFGYADSTMVKLIKGRDGKLIGKAKGFYVDDSEGPLSLAEINQPEVFAHELIEFLN